MVATPGWSFICHSRELVERGQGVRFTISRHGEAVSAFVVRFNGKVYAYLNRCAHRSLELDWNEGAFFDAFGDHLICATHGARYAPTSGTCIGGPCGGAGLVKLPVFEDADTVCIETGDDIHLINSDGVT